MQDLLHNGIIHCHESKPFPEALTQLKLPLQVITGIGKHSAGGIARLLPAVKQYLSVNNLTWNEEPGNPGQINVVIASSPEL